MHEAPNAAYIRIYESVVILSSFFDFKYTTKVHVFQALTYIV